MATETTGISQEDQDASTSAKRIAIVQERDDEKLRERGRATRYKVYYLSAHDKSMTVDAVCGPLNRGRGVRTLRSEKEEYDDDAT